MASTCSTQTPVVRVVGNAQHPDFRDAMALLRKTALVVRGESMPPEVVVIVQARPNEFPRSELEQLQRRWPLAGIVTVCGSWCEGEIRTGRPWPGVRRLYWYEFPAWWTQQIRLRSEGGCPEWLWPVADVFRSAPIRNAKIERSTANGNSLPLATEQPCAGVIVLSTQYFSTADALGDLLTAAGFATVWRRPGRALPVVRGAAVGIWDGGQLDDDEANDLREFCRSLERESTPVVALLDFPRRDRVDFARQLGVSTVIGKPWINADLIATMEWCIESHCVRCTNGYERAA